WLLLWPSSLSADYSYRQVPLVTWPPARAADWAALLALPAFGVVAGVVASLRRRLPALAFLAAFYTIALLPTTNLLVVVVGSIMADRFLYLPMVGLVGAAAVVADRTRARRATSALVALVLVACAWRTWTRNRDWA